MHQVSAFADLSTTTTRPMLSYRRAGQLDGVPVVLVHGVGSASLTWQETLRRLPADWAVLAPDLRGHGGSATPPGVYTLDELADDLARALDDAGVSAAHIVGFSVGAIIAVRFARRHAGRTLSLALLSSVADRTPQEQERALARLATIATTPPSEVAPGSATRWFTQAFRAEHADLVDAEIAIVSATDPVGYAGVYAVLARSEIVGEVAALDLPTLIVTGEHDVGSTPRMSRELHARVAGSELHIVPGVKHYVHIEAADGLAALLVPFIRHHDVPSHRVERTAPTTDETGVAS